MNGVPILIISIFSKNGLRKKNTYSIKKGIAAGIFATLSYAIVVYGMQFIEIAYVSSIREISIIFATLIGMMFLLEKKMQLNQGQYDVFFFLRSHTQCIL